MVTLLTTKERVKRRGSIAGQQDDTLIGEIIAEVSADAETFMGRHISAVERTETYQLRAHEHRVRLQGYPVSAVSEVKYSSQPGSWATGQALAEHTGYVLDTSIGNLYLPGKVPYGPSYLYITYTGGLVTGANAEAITSAFVDAYPQIAGAVDQQVVEILRRRKAPTGSLMHKGSMVQHQKDAGLLRDVRRRLNQLRRRTLT